jgi:hypothetical protein
MNHSHPLARVPDARRPMPAAVVLLVLLAQVAACQPEQPVEAPPVETTPAETTPVETTPAEASPFSLTASVRDPDNSMEPTPGTSGFRGVLTTSSALGILDFRYDAYVITARQSGTVTIKSYVLDVNPNGYRYGYGYPLSMAAIEDGASLTAYGGRYVQNALDTGTAIIEYPVQAGHQYILVYKTFGSFTPLTYRLTLPATLTVEGRIDVPPQPLPIPQSSAGLITLENPRPDALRRFVPWLSAQVSGN